MRFIIFTVFVVFLSLPSMAGVEEQRAELGKSAKAGDHVEVLALAGELLREADDEKSGEDLLAAFKAHQALNQAAEAEALIRSTLKAKPKNWRIWWAAARAMDRFQIRYGLLEGGRFVRGLSGPEEQWSGDRDRAESLQWYLEAWQRGGQDAGKSEQTELIEAFSRVVRRKDYGWMVEKTVGAPLPAYGERPVPIPDFELINQAVETVEMPWDAKNDGELFKWALSRAKELGRRPREEYDAAFGEALMDHYGLPRGHAVDWWKPDDEFEGKLRALSDLEFLEDGQVRKIVEENGFMPLLETMAMSARPANPAAERARERISSFRRARLQYDRLAREIQAWLQVIPQEKGDDIDSDEMEDSEGADAALLLTPRGRWIEELESLVGVHVEIPQVDQSFPVGRPPELTLLLQNAEDFVVTAQPIDLRLLLRRIEEYLRSDPKELEVDRLDLDYLQEKILVGGWRDLLGEERFRHRYIVGKSEWHRPKPRTIRLPLDQGGPWMVSYELPSGDQYFQLLWMADIAAVIHHGGGQSSLNLMDAREGKPIPRAKVTVLGWKRLVKPNGKTRLLVSRFQRFAGQDGQITMPKETLPEDFNWMMWMESGGKLSVLPELSRFRPDLQSSPKSRLRLLLLPQRELARPGSTVDLALIAAVADHQTGRDTESPLAGRMMKVKLVGEGIETASVEIKLDSYGAGKASVVLPDDAPTGDYRWVFESDEIEGLNRISSGQRRPGEEDLRPLLTGLNHVEVTEKKLPPIPGLKLEGLEPKILTEGIVLKIKPSLSLEANWHNVSLEVAALAGDRGPKESVSWCHRSESQEQAARGSVLELWTEGEVDGKGNGEVSLNLSELKGDTPAAQLQIRYFERDQLIAQELVELPRNPSINIQPSIRLRSQFAVVDQPFVVEVGARLRGGPSLAVRGDVLLERRFQNGFELVDTEKFTADESSDEVRFKIKDAGNYRARVVLEGQAELEEFSADFVCVDSGGGGSRIWVGELANEVEPVLVHVISELPSWDPSSQARLLIQSRWPEQVVMLYYGNSVSGFSKRLVRTRDHGAFVSLPVSLEQAPDFQVIAMVVRGARLGRHELTLRITPESRKLNLELVTSPSGESILSAFKADNSPTAARIFVRIAARRPSFSEQWIDPVEAFWQWDNPSWWGLSHSLRSFGSRGFADIISNQYGGNAPRGGALGSLNPAALRGAWELDYLASADFQRELVELQIPESGQLKLSPALQARLAAGWFEMVAVAPGNHVGSINKSGLTQKVPSKP